jgi:hypothetical protein
MKPFQGTEYSVGRLKAIAVEWNAAVGWGKGFVFITTV